MTSKISKLCLELKVVLDQETVLLDGLLEAMQQERDLLLRFQPNSLMELNKRKELILLQHSHLENERRELVLALASELKMDVESVSLRALAATVAGQLGRDLMDRRQKLVALTDGIQELNGLNKELIEFSLKSVKGSVTFLKKKFFNTQTYSADGKMDESNRYSSIRRRV